MPRRRAPLWVADGKRTGEGVRSGWPACGGRFFRAWRLTLRAIGERDAYHRAVASIPPVCSGSVQSLSLRVARTPKETSGALAFATGARRHPRL